MTKEEFTKVQNLFQEKENKLKSLETINNVVSSPNFEVSRYVEIEGKERIMIEGMIEACIREQSYYIESSIVIEGLISYKEKLSKEISDLEKKINSYFDK